MTPLDLNRIYNLLPAVYRLRDAQLALASNVSLAPSDYATLQQLLALVPSGLSPVQQQTLTQLQDLQQRGPLKSLIALFAEQIEVLQESLYQSYDDLFIETCANWVVPYIADLVGLEGLVDVPNANYTVRAAVADTIKNRQRKGTVSALESISADTTDWGANVVEFFQVLATTQFMNHPRPRNLSFANIRTAADQLLNTPFDTYARTAEMRNIETGLGKYNIPNVGVFLWRLEQQLLENSPACPVSMGAQKDARRFCFDAVARQTPLFTLPVPQGPATPRVTPLNVAMPITRRMLYDDLKGASNYYGQGKSIFLNYTLPGAPFPVTACNLSDVKDSAGNVTGWAHQPANCIGIDPELGRIAFPANQPPPANVTVNYCYGFSSEIGGGPYDRQFDTIADVSVPLNAATIQDGLNQAAGMLSASKNSVIVEITVNDYFFETPVVTIPDNSNIQLRAANGNRPVLIMAGDLTVMGGNESSFSLNGFLVSGGSITVQQTGGGVSNSIALNISHSTLNPGPTPAISGPARLPCPGIYIETANVAVAIDHSILGPILIGDNNTVSLTTCVVDSLAPDGVAYACYLDSTGPGAPLTVVTSTIVGKVHTQLMQLASNTIFFAQTDPFDEWVGPVVADQLQQGCVRFSYIPPGSVVPRAFHCYPVAGSASTPSFTSLQFADPGYCQLTDRAGLILQGADDQSEIGVFHDLFQPQRLSNLRVMLADYLRFGLEAGIFYAT